MTVNKGRVGLLVAALRSGLYQKSTGRLHITRTYEYENSGREPGWCCLGVASDIAEKFGVNVTRRTVEHDTYACEEFGGNEAYLPVEVQEWYGFTSPNPVLRTPEGYGDATAAELNDMGMTSKVTGESVPVSLEDIAGFFEATFLTDEPAKNK